MSIITELPMQRRDVLAFELDYPASTLPSHLLCLPQAYHKHTRIARWIDVAPSQYYYPIYCLTV